MPAGEPDPLRSLHGVVALHVDRAADTVANAGGPRESIQMMALPMVRAGAVGRDRTEPLCGAAQADHVFRGDVCLRESTSGRAGHGRPPLARVLFGAAPRGQEQIYRFKGVGDDLPGGGNDRHLGATRSEVDRQHMGVTRSNLLDVARGDCGSVEHRRRVQVARAVRTMPVEAGDTGIC